MTVTISGQVPGEQQNGLIDIEDELLHERTPDPITAVVVIERASLKYNDVKQEWSSTIRFRHIEPLDGELADAGRKLLEQAYEKRTGDAALPLELDLSGAVDEPTLDLDTPLADDDNVTEGPWADSAVDGPEVA